MSPFSPIVVLITAFAGFAFGCVSFHAVFSDFVGFWPKFALNLRHETRDTEKPYPYAPYIIELKLNPARRPSIILRAQYWVRKLRQVIYRAIELFHAHHKAGVLPKIPHYMRL